MDMQCLVELFLRYFSSPFRGRFDKAVFLARAGYYIKLNLKIVASFIIKVQLE